ncbi:uncharacterized protein LOC133336016 [Musca vetustissima]|uniref:uncharacterized protein LOC133336016 n=1 Tax=Musca vetustissima TaxID=27455 RepID=UPI002AB653D6|nr:uncharacterized protein LOC133336016 [Musca vetustissima]
MDEDTTMTNSAKDIDFGNDNNSSFVESSNVATPSQTHVPDEIHSRAKRFLSFPVGSSFSNAVCLTTGVIGNPVTEYISMGLNWGIAYDLPNTTWVLEHAKGFGSKDDSGVQIKRRHRRDLYGKLETIINGHLLVEDNSWNENLNIYPSFLVKSKDQRNDFLPTTMFSAGINKQGNDTPMMTSNVSSILSLPPRISSSSSSPSSAGTSLQKRLLSRSKRYLSFPEGSSFSVAVCFTVGIIGNPRYNYMSFGLNWGVAYDLPNSSWILNHLHGFAKRPIPVAMWHRRSRRTLYSEIEKFVENMGYNGRDCVLRALCESRLYFQNTKMGMIGEMLRTIFSLPRQRVYRRETDQSPDINVYDRAYRRRRSTDSDDCSAQYDCRFSLLELAFGKYSRPPPGYYEQH